jgi:heme/copper-type cytochrome/quinol oxidase subunit 2
MGLIPILLIVALVVLLLRGKRRTDAPVDPQVSGRDPVRLILFVVLVLLLIVLAVNLFAPLGNYRFWSR